MEEDAKNCIGFVNKAQNFNQILRLQQNSYICLQELLWEVLGRRSFSSWIGAVFFMKTSLCDYLVSLRGSMRMSAILFIKLRFIQ